MSAVNLKEANITELHLPRPGFTTLLLQAGIGGEMQVSLIAITPNPEKPLGDHTGLVTVGAKLERCGVAEGIDDCPDRLFVGDVMFPLGAGQRQQILEFLDWLGHFEREGRLP